MILAPPYFQALPDDTFFILQRHSLSFIVLHTSQTLKTSKNLQHEVFYVKEKKTLEISGSHDTKIIDRQRLATQNIPMQLIHYSYFRFFVELLQNLKYEVFYEKDKKT